MSLSLCFLGCMIYLCVHVCFVFPWSVSCFGAGVADLNEPPSSFLLPLHCCGLGAGYIPFGAIASNKRCEIGGGVVYVAGHPLLSGRCTRLPGCIRLRNDLYCVEWGVKLYSLTHCVFLLLANRLFCTLMQVGKR